MSRRPARWRLIAPPVALLLVAPFAPLPDACDPRADEVPAARYGELSAFGGARTRREVEEALRLVDPDGLLSAYYTLTDDALEVRVHAGDPTPAARVPLRTTAAPGGPPRRRRIALDPGHFGGAWSRIEKRHVTRGGGPPVREGDLTWATARLAARDLMATGADVRLVRGPPPAHEFPAGADPTFDAAAEAAMRLGEQRPDDPPWLAPLWAFDLWRERGRLVRETPFELYVRHDLRRRAADAAAFAADVTLSLHYDYTLSDANGILVFVPGAFVGDELATASQRFWAFRRVLDGTLGETRRLAEAFADALARHLHLPPMAVGDGADTWRPVDAGRGVYARNLAILRRTPGVALLLEGPCMNQTQEYPRLQGTEVEVDGRRYPDRVRQYADAVVEVLRAP